MTAISSRVGKLEATRSTMRRRHCASYVLSLSPEQSAVLEGEARDAMISDLYARNREETGWCGPVLIGAQEPSSAEWAEQHGGCE